MHRLFAFPVQILRGMGNLPHVGSHPGTSFMILLLVMGMTAGFQSGGWKTAVFIGLAVPLSIFPIYAWGAFDRARISDTHGRREDIRALLGAYLATLPEPPKRPAVVKFLYWSQDNRLVLDVNLTCGIVEPVAMPDWLHDAVRQILTRPANGNARHSPRATDLASMRIEPPQLSAHARMRALGIVREAGAPLPAT